MSDHILTIKEVASFLKVHERTVYRLAAKGDIPAFKVANSWRFRQEDIDHWITQQTSFPLKVNGAEGDV
ncbi:methylation-associated defense system helix-turn-helix domain-containing protein MAD1 [Marinobacterium rhizophilum]|uniref:Helix-turn-helix domain-containing protein n=1 Tax=Marinobacterium rhizophilum TaxID=420402 RepID=A0ABY5HL25_9GAMM|nr:helix-turn-helix domain-containing protein [Marinobacterium rhizophilum]UTW11959.1 helix-turn-helix domain-containing protein [Marinobacterium rhizophilum]